MERHLIVDFGLPGVLPQHYRAQDGAAQAYALEATLQRWARVTVDDQVTDELKPLPYQRLFMP